jgi:hypothetical protein
VKRTVVLALGLLGVGFLAGCGSSGSSTTSSGAQPLSQNWQLTMAPQVDSQSNPLFTGGLLGGFLLQKGNAVSGSFAYSVLPTGSPTACAGGSAPVSGTVSGQMVTLTALAGGQTFDLTGTLAADGSLMGTYTTTDGAPLAGGGTCGVAQTGLTWSAHSVPSITGSFQGNFHHGSVSTLTGTLLEGANTGATSTTVTGEVFSDDYSCFSHASLNGTISGTSVLLSIIGDNGLIIGQIGSNGQAGSNLASAVVEPALGGAGLIVRGTTANRNGYGVTNNACPNGDAGSVCLGVGNAQACAQPLSFSLSSLTFPAQPVGTLRSQALKITNTAPDGVTLDGLTLTPPSLISEFNAVDNFQESDTCGSSPFSLAAGQSCTATITFSPQQSCTKDPVTATTSVPALRCPSPLVSALTVLDPNSTDGSPNYSVPVGGTGLSAIVPLEAQLGFSAVAQGQSTPTQTVTLVNSGTGPVTILPAIPGSPCVPSPASMQLPGLQIVSPAKDGSPFPDNSVCHFDLSTDGPPNFPITEDQCSGATLNPGKSCTFSVAFAPQADLANANDLTTALDDFFVQLSTVPCTASVTTFCEIDSGRVPIQIKWNNQSPLRISPNAGFDFGPQAIGTDTVQAFTLFNDPSDPNSTTVEFLSIATKSTSRFSQNNTCGASLAPGSSCTINVIFHPTGTGLAQDAIVITPKNNLTEGAVQNIYLWGRGQ